MRFDLAGAVRSFVDGLRVFFRELYRTPPAC